jgi:hypothetical protein
MAERKAVTKQMARRYAAGNKKTKGMMLGELCSLTDWSRRHGRRALGAALKEPSQPRVVRRRPLVYDQDVLHALRKIWATLDGPCGKRLAPFLPEMVAVMERHK